jgi:phenylpyruvate tautomerase
MKRSFNMPCLIVHRNFEIDEAAADKLSGSLSSITEEVLGKPSNYIMVIVDTPQKMYFGGSDAPALFIEVKSIGLPGDTPAQLSRRICDAAFELLSVPPDRVYLEFADSPRNMWGWNGGTF